MVVRIWCKKYPDGCLRCRTKSRPHHGQGLCTRCYRKVDPEPKVRFTKRRVRDGIEQRLCHTCEVWKNVSEFKSRSDGRVYGTLCADCDRALRRERYRTNGDAHRARRRARYWAQKAAIAEADRKRAARDTDPWTVNRPLIPVERVAEWLSAITDQLTYDDAKTSYQDVARAANITPRKMYSIRHREVTRVSVDVAERIAIAAGRMDEFRDLTTPGVIGWSQQHRYCLRCGRYDIPHHGRGYCVRCYQTYWWYQRTYGVEEPPPPLYEMWARGHLHCIDCRQTRLAHWGRGLCSSCYRKALRKARAADLTLAQYLATR